MLLGLAAAAAARIMGMWSTPGVPGLITLPTTVVIGRAIAIAAVGRLRGLQQDRGLATLAAHAITHVIVAAVFWAWASYKLLAKGDPDFGVVSFLLAGCTSYRTADLCAVHVTRGSAFSRRRSCNTLATLWLHPAALLVVTANYGLALVAFPLPPVFQLYCALGAALWAVAAAQTYRLLAELKLADGGACAACGTEQHDSADELPQHASLCEAQQYAYA